MTNPPSTSHAPSALPKRSRRVFFIVALIGVVYLAAVFFYVLDNSWLVSEVASEGKFDAKAWQAFTTTAEKDPRARSRMLTDLRQNHLPQGMPRTEVLALLGAPDLEAEHACFYVVSSSSLKTRPGRLRVAFDAAGLLIETTVLEP